MVFSVLKPSSLLCMLLIFVTDVIGLSSSPTTRSGCKQHAVVVGGGPVGLATALTLAKQHSYDVTLVEAAPTAGSYTPTKAYLYNVNARGQVFTRQYPEIQKKLVERGVTSSSGFIVVPADPKEALPEEKSMSRARGMDDKKKKNKAATVTQDSYWIPRHTFTTLLQEALEEHEDERVNSKKEEWGKIEFCQGRECVAVKPTETGTVEVTVKDKIEESPSASNTYEATLVVGADGMNSKVRECMEKGKEDFDKWPNVNCDKFRVKKYISPASGLRNKVLQFPPQFVIPNGDGTPVVTKGRTIYAIRSVNTGPRNYLNLGLLPVYDNNMIRPTNVIGRPNHEVWTITDGPKMREWFEKAFPRLDFSTLIDDAEWERFAKAEGTRFPPCQHSPGLQLNDGDCGIVLVGDASHAYPPDIGQGVNSGLADVVALDRALKGEDQKTGEPKKEAPANLGEALEEYERVRSPEIKALIRLARFGSPYQYRQPLRLDRIGRQLWTLNLLFRLVLNKLTFGLVPTQAIMLAQNPSLTFRQVMRRADTTTNVFLGILGTAAFMLFRRFLVKA